MRDFVRSKLAKSERAQKLAAKLESASSRDAGLIGKTIGRPFMPLARLAGRKMGSENVEALKRVTAKAETDANKMSAQTVASRLKGNMSMAQKVGYLNAKIKSGDIDDLLDAGLTKREVLDIRRSAVAVDQHQDIDAAFPHLIPEQEVRRSFAARALSIKPNQVTAAQLAAVLPAEVVQERTRTFRRMRADRTKQISRGALTNTDTLDAMLRGWDGRHMGPFITQHGQEGIEALEKRIDILALLSQPLGPTLPLPTDHRVVDMVTRGIPLAEAQRRVRMRDWTEANNVPLAKYFQSQTGQQLGFSV